MPRCTARRTAAIAALVAASSLTAAPQANPAPDEKTTRDYRLTLEKVEKYTSLTKTIRGNNDARACLDKNEFDKAPTLSAADTRFKRCPTAVAILKESGLAPRDLKIIPGLLLAGFMAVTTMEQDPSTPLPDAVSPANAEFIQQNHDKLVDMLQEIMQPQ